MVSPCSTRTEFVQYTDYDTENISAYNIDTTTRSCPNLFTCSIKLFTYVLTSIVNTRSFVFPSATHTRFEHSLGVAHRAHELAEQIYRGQGAELSMTMVDVQTVTLAGMIPSPESQISLHW